MKLAILNLILFFFCANLHGKGYPGYFVTKDGEKVKASFDINVTNNGTFKISGLHSSVKYFTSGGRKETLKAEDAKELAFPYNGDTIRFISEKLGSNITGFSGEHFLHLFMKNEKITVYKYYDTPTHSNSVYAPYYILQKPGGKFFRVMWNISFKSELAGYFADCPELAKLLKSGDFKKKTRDGYDDLYQRIADYYTNSCEAAPKADE